MKIKDEMPAHVKMIILCALIGDIERSKKFVEDSTADSDGPSIDFWKKEFKDASEALIWMRKNSRIVSLSH